MSVFDKAAALAECLCAQIAAEGLPELCFCGLIPGASVVQDYLSCDGANGMAWVRLDVGAPINGIGVTNEMLNNCASDLGFDLEVGIYRQIELDPQPDPADVLAAAKQQLTEMETMRRAIACCDALGDFILEAYSPIGPVGGLVGGTWSLTTGLS